jgi:hypothetical protein
VLSVTDGSSVIFDQTPPTLPSVGIVSSNAAQARIRSLGVSLPVGWDSGLNVATGVPNVAPERSLFDRVTDTVTLSILADEFIYMPSIQFWSGSSRIQSAVVSWDVKSGAAQSVSNRNFSLEFNVSAKDCDGLITFNVTFSDAASNIAVATATTDGSTLKVDNTPPRAKVTVTSNNPAQGKIAAIRAAFKLPNSCVPGRDDGCVFNMSLDRTLQVCNRSRLDNSCNRSKGPILDPETRLDSGQWHTGSVMFYDTGPTGNGIDSTAKPLFWDMSMGPNAAKLNDTITLWVEADEFIYQPTCVFYFAEPAYDTGGAAFEKAYKRRDAGTQTIVDWDRARPDRTELQTFTAPAQNGTRISYAKVYTEKYMQSRVTYQDVNLALRANVTGASSNDNLLWKCSYTVESTDSDGPVAFTVYYDDAALISGTPLHNNGYSRMDWHHSYGSVYVDKTAPTLKSVQIESNNVAVNNIGTLGDNIILTFAADEEIYTPECRFFSGKSTIVPGTVASYSIPAFRTQISTNTGLIEWSCSYEVLTADPTDPTKDLMGQNWRCTSRQCDQTGLITFEIYYSDIAGNQGPMVDRTMGSTLQAFLPCFGSFCMNPVQDYKFISGRGESTQLDNGTNCTQRMGPDTRILKAGVTEITAGFTSDVSYGSRQCNPSHPSSENVACEYGPSFAHMGQLCKMCPHPFVVDSTRTTCQACPAGQGPNIQHAPGGEPCVGPCCPCSEGTTSAFGVCEACAIGSTANVQRSECIDVDECSDMNGGCDMFATLGVEQAGATCVNLEPTTGGYRCGTCPPGLRTVVTSNKFFVDRLLTHGIVKRMGPVNRINGSQCLLPTPPARPVDGSPYDPGVTVQPKITLKLTRSNCVAADIPGLRRKMATAMRLRESDLFAMGCGSAASFHGRRLSTAPSSPTATAEVSFMLISPNALDDARRFNYQLGYGNTTAAGAIPPLIATGEIIAAPFGAFRCLCWCMLDFYLLLNIASNQHEPNALHTVQETIRARPIFTSQSGRSYQNLCVLPGLL